MVSVSNYWGLADAKAQVNKCLVGLWVCGVYRFNRATWVQTFADLISWFSLIKFG